MKKLFAAAALLALGALPASTRAGEAPPPAAAAKPAKMMYTTYFYTAGEAIVQGYEDDTHVRIIAGQGKKGTIWEGVVKRGDAKLVPTGAGVFGFLSDKKATILVGTPQSCTVVGYFAKNENGAYRSSQFFVQMPSAPSSGAERLVIWAYEDTDVDVRIPNKQKLLKHASLKAGEHVTLIKELNQVTGATLEVKASKSVAAQVYFDEGFIVPADNGRGAGTTFYTYVGTLTEGSNDLNVIAQGHTANVTVTDVEKGKTLFSGKVESGTAKTLDLADKYVKVTSDVAVNVTVAALKHSASGYAEQHFAAGLEGGLIENDFLVNTSGDLWLFSYYDGNQVTVSDPATGKVIGSAKLGAGGITGMKPGDGLYKVHAQKGLSVMGGASSCGADYSPAGGLFAMDEAVVEVVAKVREERIRQAEAGGRSLSEAEKNAPVNEEEWRRHRDDFSKSYKDKAAVQGAATAAPAPAMSLDEFNQRANAH